MADPETQIPGNEPADGGGGPTPVVASVEEYAIVEVMGHRTIIGRVTEVTRFGGTLMSIEPIYRGDLQQVERVPIWFAHAWGWGWPTIKAALEAAEQAREVRS